MTDHNTGSLSVAALPRISVSVKAAIVRDDRILLLSYDDHAGFHYNLPGGKAREGEPLRDAVRRKVLQETGLRVEPRRLLFVVEYVPTRRAGEFGNVHKVQFNLLAELLDPRDEPRMPDPPDPIQLGVEWLPVERLSTAPLLPRIAEPLRAALARTDPDALLDRW
ncbi:MAG: NUDIX domain-containing protein [Dermatophilaceae bacterium]